MEYENILKALPATLLAVTLETVVITLAIAIAFWLEKRNYERKRD